ncbi:putative lipid II flippase FtsW [Candidatus Nitrosacidococcus tergens]|uniref:Probable peptidoglycan glycosyltransferase FtsW n=1 Tax=Candidatus Nitrosacidococcus tergens TaxID=553981 RepID=A0A7G1QB54_9GAMM|nr:putative lipid II flippase FtsW [Candidatus Nitrosacidococcus tergens]CAB1276935.1 integral membrane protein involved in stabilizing FstZ ring during cell division [Candidatus Nitrosacidococcus tergens]
MNPSPSQQQLSLDPYLLGSALALLGFGWVMVGSASIAIAENNFGIPTYYFWRQGIFLSLGLITAFSALKVKLVFWEKAAPIFLFISAGLLILVLIPKIGLEINGSRRWLGVGAVRLQPSELVKLFMIIYLAGYLVRRKDIVRTAMRGFLFPIGLFTIISGLLLLEPDFGTIAVLFATIMGMLFLGGAPLRYFLFLVILGGSSLAAIAWHSPYRVLRLTSFLNPWDDPLNSGYQLTQALIAFGRGSWFGVGLGDSVQKLFYLPEAHTDFLYAVIGEELGLIGSLAVIILFSVLIYRTFMIGWAAEQRGHFFGSYLAYGLGIWIGLQAFVNLGVNMGILPTKGLTLPLMSAGGSSSIVICVAISLVLRVDMETRFPKVGQSRSK